mgnify:CR=1 FL=1
MAPRKERKISINIDPGVMSAESQKIVDAIKLQLEQMQESFLAKLNAKNIEIDRLQLEVNTLKNKIGKLEERVDDGDAYERRDALVITGDGVPKSANGESCKEIVSTLLRRDLKIHINGSDISTSHRYGAKPPTQKPDNRGIIVKFCRRDLKHEILAACRTIKPNFCVNENLTPVRSTILYVLRRMKQRHPDVVSYCGSREGKIFAWIKSVNSAGSERDTKIFINSYTKLQQFCGETLKKELTSFIEVWPH